jgi:hypothetical protein
MADSPRVPDLHDRLPGVRGSDQASGSRLPPQAVRRIKVVERPGADFAAPEHDIGNDDCWCEPDVWDDDTDDAVQIIVHREFEN